MEIETQEETVAPLETKNVLYSVTPFSKYLALALFIIFPFLGGWIGYTYAPDKVVEKVVIKEVKVTAVDRDSVQNSVSEAGQVVSTEGVKRVSVSRNELIENEAKFMEQFGIDLDEKGRTKDLYWQEDKNVEDSTVLFSDRGLTTLLPYNEGWGFPYYKYTPYDLVEDVLLYGNANPCPAGCMDSGAFIGGKIEFHPLDKTLEEIVGDDTNYNSDSCVDVKINSSVTGQRCWGDGVAFEHAMVIKGTKYKYEFKNWRCQEDLDVYQADSEFYTECLTLNQSIKVE